MLCVKSRAIATGDIRRFGLKIDALKQVTPKELLSRCVIAHGGTVNNDAVRWKLYWIDSDGDRVTITCQNDVTQAILEAENSDPSVLRLELKRCDINPPTATILQDDFDDDFIVIGNTGIVSEDASSLRTKMCREISNFDRSRLSTTPTKPRAKCVTFAAASERSALLADIRKLRSNQNHGTPPSQILVDKLSASFNPLLESPPVSGFVRDAPRIYATVDSTWSQLMKSICRGANLRPVRGRLACNDRSKLKSATRAALLRQIVKFTSDGQNLDHVVPRVLHPDQARSKYYSHLPRKCSDDEVHRSCMKELIFAAKSRRGAMHSADNSIKPCLPFEVQAQISNFPEFRRCLRRTGYVCDA